MRELPAMNRFLKEPVVAGFAALFGTTVVKTAVDDVLREAQAIVRSDSHAVIAFDDLLFRVHRRLSTAETDGLLPVINGTGILLHTNLGRAPLAPDALHAMHAIAGGYSNLEFDLGSGSRGSRYARVTALLAAATSAEDALVVNNCAAAVLLILDTFAKGREVVVSRNQLVEIGGGFRLPDVLARSGARLVEVGATNKVYLYDFERALTAQTALLLRSHASNYRIEGFTADVAAASLAELGKRAGILTVEDLGGGALVDLRPYGLPHERTVLEAVADGIDLVAFSGDKLLGGPQAGIIVGRRSAIARLRGNPLLRALRVDKATLAALGATVRLYLRPGGVETIPFYAMLATKTETLAARARTVIAAVHETALANGDGAGSGRGSGDGARADAVRANLSAVATEAYAGGGAAPLAAISSFGIALRNPNANANAFSARLRERSPRVIARVAGDAVIVDMRTIPPERDADLTAALLRAGADPGT